MNNERLNRYLQQQIEEKAEELKKNSSIIDSFISFCKSKKIELTQENFDYIQTIGIVAKFPNIVYLLDDKVTTDKEYLVNVDLLECEYQKKTFASGYYYSDKYMIMAHPYFRRGHHEDCNFSPRFIEKFWIFDKKDIQKYIAIDSDRVRINVDNVMYMELDTWYGAKFQRTIKDIEDGIVKLRPPLELSSFEIGFLFGNTYSLDIKWSSKNGIKTFQAEEFKSEDCKIVKNGNEYFPVKYLHAEFDINKNIFRHFDGAIHFYTSDEYYQRRDSDFNYNSKNSSQLKTLSMKLFKINGFISIEDWLELTSQYLTGNPLIFEYFEEKLPDNVLEFMKNKKNDL